MKNTFEDLSGIAARYYPATHWGVAGILGVDTKKDKNQFTTMVKFYRLIFMEKNMNFYLGTGAGLMSRGKQESTTENEPTETKNSIGFALNGFFGGEFFLPGLENLGLSFETGVEIVALEGEVRFQTIGMSPFRAGIVFYF